MVIARQRPRAVPHSERDPRQTDRQSLLNVTGQWNLTLPICWQAAAVKKDKFLEPQESWRGFGKEGPRKICFLST